MRGPGISGRASCIPGGAWKRRGGGAREQGSRVVFLKSDRELFRERGRRNGFGRRNGLARWLVILVLLGGALYVGYRQFSGTPSP